MEPPPHKHLKEFLRSPPDPSPEESQARRSLGKYRIDGEIARGGMATVYLAYDTELKRTVALKVLSEAESSPGFIKRLHQEAALSASLKHPNIISVHDVGIATGPRGPEHYICMDLIEGTTLGRMLSGKTYDLKQVVGTIEQVARAVHYAHEQGIVHRDIKPDNVLLEASGRPVLTDFGLARTFLFEGTRITRSGTLMGTPAYMAPEQARGDHRNVDERTDLYALGVMLYEAATGTLPFNGTNVVEVCKKIQDEEPPLPRAVRPELDKDLETVILRSMEKEPSRRYGSARELADDLRAWLSGEPIRARRSSWTYRVSKRIRKNRAAYGLGACAVLAALVALVFWLASAEQAKRARLEKEAVLQTMRDTARASLEAALKLRRAGHNLGMRTLLPPLETAYRGVAERAPELAEPDYLMGRMHRALLEDDRALRYQERALGKDRDYGPALYERILLVMKRYNRERQKAFERLQLSRALSEQFPAAPSTEEAHRLRPELAQWRKEIFDDARRLLAGAPDETQALVVRGILAWYDGNASEGSGLLKNAIQRDADSEEAWEILATESSVLAERHSSVQMRDQSRQSVEEMYTRALARDQGYMPFLFGRGSVRLLLGYSNIGLGQDPRKWLEGARSDYTRILVLEPGSSRALERRGVVRLHMGDDRMNRGEDPLPDYDGALQDLGDYLKAAPGDAHGSFTRGSIRAQRGEALRRSGQDPTKEFDEADADLSAALKTDPLLVIAWEARGTLRGRQGQALLNRGLDPTSHFDSGEKDLTEAIRLNRDSPGAWSNRGSLRGRRAQYLRSRNADPMNSLAEAESDFTESLKLDSQRAAVWRNRALTRGQRAQITAARDGDPLADLAAAENDLSRALELNPEFAVA
jgi:serine/threonine-protein kinase